MERCKACGLTFMSQRALSMHFVHSNFCSEYYTRILNDESNVKPTLSKSKIAVPPVEQLEHVRNEINAVEETNNLITQVIIDDDFLLKSFDSLSVDSNSNLFHDSEIIHKILLVKLLTKIGAPLYAYHDVMQWAYTAHTDNYSFNTKRKTYKQIIKCLEKKCTWVLVAQQLFQLL